MEKVGYVSVIWLPWCGVGGVGDGVWAARARVWEGGVYVCCESGLFVLMAGPGICILC